MLKSGGGDWRFRLTLGANPEPLDWRSSALPLSYAGDPSKSTINYHDFFRLWDQNAVSNA